MKFGIRTISAMAAILAMIAAGLSYWAGDQISMAGRKGGDARSHVQVIPNCSIVEILGCRV
jgi:hypothetical protein